MYTFGYGCRTDIIKWKSDAYKTLLEMVKKDIYIKKEFEDYFKENKSKFENEVDCFEYWSENVFEGDTNLVSGIEGIVVELINNQYHETVFTYEDCCIFVQATIPIDEDDYVPTQKEIREVLAKYLNPLIEEPVTVGWYDVYY